MARKKRDGIYLHGKTWWCRDPLNSGRKTSTGYGREQEKEARRWLDERKHTANDPAHAAAPTERLGIWCIRTLATTYATTVNTRVRIGIKRPKNRADFEIRTRDQRFTKPIAVIPFTPSKADIDADLSPVAYLEVAA